MTIKIEERSSKPQWTPCPRAADGWGGGEVFHVQFHPGTDSIVHVIVQAVASIRNTEPTELDPLGNHIDVSLLENIVDPGSGGGLHCEEVTFRYEGLKITLDVDGDLWLEWD